MGKSYYSYTLLLFAPITLAWPFQVFLSANFTPPVLSIEKSGAELGDGYLVFSDYFSPLMYRDDGTLIWNGHATFSANLDIQTYQGEQVLTYWTGGLENEEATYGHFEMYDNTYTLIKSFCPSDLVVTTPSGLSHDCYMDLHESLITPWNTIVFPVTNVTKADLRPVGGPASGWIYDSLFFEYDLDGTQLFRWSALEHIPLTQSKSPPPTGLEGVIQSKPWAWFHFNTIDPIGQGQGYLINSRYTWGSYRLSSEGDVLWSINGYDGGNFTLPSTPLFEWQHDSRLVNITSTSAILHYFNNFNSNYGPVTQASTAPYLHLDFTTWTVTVLEDYTDPNDEIKSKSQGNHDVLPNENHLVCYGSEAKIKEFGPEGDVRMTIQYGQVAEGYRAHRRAWKAYPAAPPSVAGVAGIAYMSWNGATEVASWKVYAGGLLGPLTEVGEVAKTGFETKFATGVLVGYVQAGAFDASGAFLGNSSKVLMI